MNIVEGVFIYHDQRARDLIDLRFFIDLPVEEMIRRRLARTPVDSTDPWDAPEYITGEMVKGTEKYVMPQREHSHVVLDGLLPTSELANIVIAQIEERRLK